MASITIGSVVVTLSAHFSPSSAPPLKIENNVSFARYELPKARLVSINARDLDELERKVLALLVAELGQAKVWSAHVSDGKTDAATFEEANAQAVRRSRRSASLRVN